MSEFKIDKEINQPYKNNRKGHIYFRSAIPSNMQKPLFENKAIFQKIPGSNKLYHNDHSGKSLITNKLIINPLKSDYSNSEEIYNKIPTIYGTENWNRNHNYKTQRSNFRSKDTKGFEVFHLPARCMVNYYHSKY